MKRFVLLIVIALLAASPRESAAQISEQDCFTVLPTNENTELGNCGIQFWQPSIQTCFSTLVEAGTLCAAASSSCEKPSVCAFGGTFQDLRMGCTPLGTPKITSKVCRASTGVCDQDDYCDGTSLECPADEAAPETTLCRPSAGACDVSDFCDGVSKTCPDELVPEGETCRTTEDQCDIDESCDGISPSCPEDELGEGMECDDGDECTDSDTCSQGQCVGDGIDNCPAVEPDAGPDDSETPSETPEEDTEPGTRDAGVDGEGDTEDNFEGEGGGGCSVATKSSRTGWLFLFLVGFICTRRRRLGM